MSYLKNFVNIKMKYINFFRDINQKQCTSYSKKFYDIGLNNQLKKDKMIEFTNKGREIDKVYGDFEVLLRDFEKEFISLSA